MPLQPPQSPILTFEMLDDVLFQPVNLQKQTFKETSAYRIGPLVELGFTNTDHLKSLSKHKSQDEVEALLQAMAQKGLAYSKGYIATAPKFFEFFRTPQTADEFECDEWNAFARRFENAATQAGLPKIFAKELTGTFGEMASNLFEHSERITSGLVGYRWNQQEFEYIVADNGIGVLKSLQKHSDYASLADSEEALLTALTEGESRHGRAAKRGNGFNTLTLNIASRSSCLRFRSGDRSHVIDGRKNRLIRTSFTCTHYQGFLISVLCKTRTS